MKIGKRIAALSLSAALLTSVLPGVSAAGSNTFRDVPAGHWASAYVEELALHGLVEGVGKDRFAPEETLTNAAFVVMALRPFSAVLGLDLDALDGQDSWYQGYLDAARELGLLDGCGFTDAQANSPMSRYDMASFIAALGQRLGVSAPDGAGGAEALRDYAAMPEARRQAVDYACALGLLTGYDDGAFHGEEKMTRAQAAAVLSRLLEAAPGQPGRVQTVQTGERSASTYSYASTKRWTGQRGDAWAFEVDSVQDMESGMAQAMDSYPRTVIFFSDTELDWNPKELVETYEITHGLHNRHKASSCNGYVFTPQRTGGDYYEYRLELYYSAAGLVRMYREGRIDALPDTMDFNWPKDPADYTILLDAVEKIEADYGLTAASSEYDRAYAAYHYLTENCSYDYAMAAADGQDLVHMFDSVLYPDEINYMLTYHKGVCFEYALTYQALCYVLGLDCYVVSGNAGGPHAWNIVKVDGQWYQADATWDAGRSQYSYFLVSDRTMSSRTVTSGYYDYPACPADYPA